MISQHPVTVEERNTACWIRHDVMRRMAVFSCLWLRKMRRYLHFFVLRNLDISHQPSMLEICKYHHSTRLVMTNPTSWVSFFYSHWMPRYFSLNILAEMLFLKNFVNFDITNVTTFRWILIVERWNAACSIRQYKTHRMAVFSCL